MKKNIILVTAFILVSSVIYNKGMLMADEKLNYDNQSEKLKNTDVSGEISKEEAVTLVKKYILSDKELKRLYSLNKPKADGTRLSEGYWKISFPLKFWHRPLLGLIPDWGVFYVNVKTGEVEGGGQTFDL